MMFEHIRSIQKRDPASPTFLEVVFGYNGFHAIFWHRMNNALWRIGFRGLSRCLANFARIFTGIEIHPEADIGKNLFIDHGTGIVIGQTSIIEDDVTMYHGVTLGGKGGDTAGSKRHPTVKKGAIIGSGSHVLGDITIGVEAKVGASSVVTKSVPDGCTVVGNPARLVNCEDTDKGKAYGLPKQMVDPVTEVINGLLKDVQALKEKADLKEKQKVTQEEYAEHWKGSGI